MRRGRSFEIFPKSRAAVGWARRVRFAPALAAAALLASACTGAGSGSGSGSSSVPASSAGGGGGYPDGPITFVVPFTAGGPTDTVTRLIAAPMGETLGATIVVQNVEGAGGTVAAGEVANAEPDGYTVLMHHIGMSTAPTLYTDLGYDPLSDFRTIGLVTEVPMTIIGRKNLEPTTLEELVEYVKANGEAVRYANAGIGAASHLCGLLFQSAIETTVTEVPYDGTADALTALVGSGAGDPADAQVDFLCDQTTNTTGNILAGEVKAYAVTTPERVASL
ncbi:MAG TPA: tripartite tricarboxylate transporter substrate-binding protein, partial [Candidatus Dormibacteraeota bacterium]|nr:tripartite tricarboxylate transporter substrate-binding protein [Candidatus Dormibacteraeota bacterium]